MAGIDTTPSTVATNALQAIPFGSIIGGPLSACIEAQANAAKTSWEFIRDVGLTDSENGEKKAIYVNFEYRKDGHKAILSVPLLTIVPIPYIAIKDIDIQFKASISAASSVSTTESTSTKVDVGMKAKAGFNLGIFHGSMEMNASVSSKKDSSSTRDSKYSVEYTMDVAVKAGQDSMPAGMAKVLELLNESIDTIQYDGELIVSAQKITTEDGGVYVTYKNEDGYYAPEDIKIFWVENGNATNGANGAKALIDGTGAVCLLSKAGEYLISAGKKSVLVVVSEAQEDV